ncbi:MAG: hypothetical protein RIT81_29955 [Deltaproteobacteria bacterium]
MNALVTMFFGHPATVALVILSLVAMGGVTFWSFRRSRRLSDKATHLLYLALDGRADEARIQARQESRELRPVLDALGGEATPISARPLIQDAVAVAALTVLPMVMIAYGFGVLTDPESAKKIEASTALLVGIAVLIPIGVAAIVTILEMSRRSARDIRGACITLLARSVKTVVETERSEALRRGANVRDPRGE